MSTLIIVDRAGIETRVEAEGGRTVMEVIRDNGFEELLALCGGSCSCATCHVYVTPGHGANLPPPADFENDLLDSSGYRRPESRLSCQIPFSDQLDGLRVTIAPED